jgi:hypothetical protein
LLSLSQSAKVYIILLTIKKICRLALIEFALIAFWSWGLTTISQAEVDNCPNESIRLSQNPYGAQLPNCRAYEQVSPVEKNLSDAIGHTGLTQVSPNGERVTFGSVGPFPNIPGSSAFPTYLAVRAADGSGWITQGLLPATSGPRGKSATRVAIEGLTEDLSYALLSAGESYLYNTSDRQLLPFPFVDEGFVDASSDDSTSLFASGSNLYEWKAGQSSLVEADAVAGPDVTAGELGHNRETYTEYTISADGSRVFYTSRISHQIFMREELGTSVEISKEPAEWRAATPDGSSVFYTEGERIPVPGGTSVGGGLYRWTKHGSEPEHVTTIAEPSAGVLGTLGISDDGTYAYFVAEGEKLAGENTKGEEPIEGRPNLYEWHEEGLGTYTYTYIATLARGFDPENWTNYNMVRNGPAEGFRTAQVTPDGRVLMFMSEEHLTGYESHGSSEIFRYDAADFELACVSCNPLSPNGASGSGTGDSGGGAFLSVRPIPMVVQPPRRERPFAMYNMSEDGQRIFFETEESLVPQDKNDLMDVYEWENGHLYLISCGCGEEAYLGGASASGRDVFFFTRQPLVAQDQDENFDLYDARENGGIPGQNEVAPSPCAKEETCRGAIAAPSSFAIPASAVFSGAGDVASVLPQESVTHTVKSPSKSVRKPKCRRGYRLNKHRRCVKVKIAGHRR